MRATSLLRRPLAEEVSASQLLGRDHPLVRVLDQIALTWAQGLVVGAALLTGAAGSLAGVSHALPLVLGAAAAEVVLMCRAALLTLTKRDRAVEVIAEGGEAITIGVVQRQRRRLLLPRRRRQLAATLIDMRLQATRPIPRPPSAPPVFDRRTIAAVGPELATIAALLRDDRVGARGVAMIERLVVDGGSVLYRQDVHALRQELRRIRYVLEA